MKSARPKAHGAYCDIDALLRLRNLARDITLQTRASSTAIMDGDSRTRFRGRGMEFSEVRPYQAGDDIRNIDWRVTARTQKPYTKLFQEEKERPVFLLVDQRSPMFFGSRNVFKSVYTVELATVIAWAALRNNDRIGALIFGDQEQKDLRARRGKHAVLNLIHELQGFNHALFQPRVDKQQRLQDRLMDLRRVARPGSAIYIISDFHDYHRDCDESLSMLSRHTDLSIIQVYDPLERQLPDNKFLSISDGQNKLDLAGPSRQFYDAFQQKFIANQNALRQACQRSGVTFASMDVSIPLENCVRDTFESTLSKKRRQVRRSDAL